MSSLNTRSLALAIAAVGTVTSLFLVPHTPYTESTTTPQVITATTTTTTQPTFTVGPIRNRLVLDGATVAILGSSTMTGTVGTTRPWPTLLATAFAEQGVHVTINNQAVGGTVVADYLAGGRFYDRIVALRANPPTVILLGTRTNDYHAQLPHGEFERQYEELVRSLPPASRRILVNLAWVKTTQTPTYDQRGYYDAIVRVAGRTGNLPILRLDLCVPVSDEAHLYQDDNMHMNDAGQQVIFTAVHTAITSLTW